MNVKFLCESAENIANVFPPYITDIISAIAKLDPTPYSKSSVISAPAEFADTEILFSTWGMPQFSAEEIRTYLPKLKCVFYGAGTVQAFARPFLECGVKVFSAWAANAVPVAEMTVAQIILANKGYYLTSRLYHEKGRRAACDAFETCRGNFGETVGIIGAGMIGQLVIRMLKAYKLNVIVFDPFLPDEKAMELGVQKCDLPTLFRRSLTVSNHLANNAQTRGMLNYALFSQMRQNAVFINTGRGAQVVEEDLVRILTEREDITALLDVTNPEPPVEGHPFYTLKNCILTPHIAGSAGDEVARMGEYMLHEFEAYLSGNPLRYEVTEQMLETMA
ncbi:MAG: hydroxyacid dehydrogenase [Clostridia bacterium]|nr:hydroxyacid dehydrogenase [Clostridia bacterium]